jgi:hypothetical protein
MSCVRDIYFIMIHSVIKTNSYDEVDRSYPSFMDPVSAK